MDFDEWIQYGVNNGFCSEQFCTQHGDTPFTGFETSLHSRDDWDSDFLCVHAVRLGNEKDWDKDADSFMIDQLPESR